MNKSIKTFLVSFFLLANWGLLFSQETRLEYGDKYFDQYAYEKAIEFYEGMNDNQKTWQIYAKLGDCYYYTSHPEIAHKRYKSAIDLAKIKKADISATYLLKYAQCLQSSGEPFVNAFQAYYDKINNNNNKKIKPRDSTINRNIEIENMNSINTEYSDFGTFIFNDTLYFASSRKNMNKEKNLNKKLYNWNEQFFLNIYGAAIDRNADTLKFVPPYSSILSSKINSIAHESTVAIMKTKDSTKTYVYYSGGLVNNNKLVYNKRGTSRLRLKRISKSVNTWKVSEKDSIAMDLLYFENYSVGNPALNPKKNRLYFSSCAPFSDAMGQTDIFYINLKDNEPCGKVKSLPIGINTSGRESFPFISADGTLYFSSEGIYKDTLGLGLLDIYKVKNFEKVIDTVEYYEAKIAKAVLLKDTIEVRTYTEIKNRLIKKMVKIEHLDSPINSPMDDFAFFIEEPKKDDDCEVHAYFSSNWEDRPNAKGSDDIYRVKMPITKTIRGIVTDTSTQLPLANASVQLLDASEKVLKTVKVDSSGAFSFDGLECNQRYFLKGSKNMYEENLKEFNSSQASDIMKLALKLNPCEIHVNKIIVFDPKDSDVISPQVTNDLLPLLGLLRTNPDIKIRIESFTDSQGRPKHNLNLSQRRANATRKYLIDENIDESRILSAKGFGEKCLLINDEEINKLTDRDSIYNAHLINRRSQILIEGCNESVRCKE